MYQETVSFSKNDQIFVLMTITLKKRITLKITVISNENLKFSNYSQ